MVDLPDAVALWPEVGLKAPYAAIDEKMFTEKFMDLIRGSDA